MRFLKTVNNVIEPDHGKVLDPACGSGGMFVQSAHFIERMHEIPQERVTFYGQEKNPTTIRLAKMNLAVHGLEGNIQKGITYYEDHHEMLGKADFVMANPPFNVDEVDAGKVKNDPRLPFGLPGVNKKKAVSNGNYLWISYFYSYLNEQGRSGFVMSSQASGAGRDEAKVRRKIIETGHVDVMIAIRSNFFYTRSVPCELWFFNKNKPEDKRGKVLMLDARNVYRQVTRKIYDFSPEQMKNLTSIVWLYRGQSEHFLSLVAEYMDTAVRETGETFKPLEGFKKGIDTLMNVMEPFLSSLSKDDAHGETLADLKKSREVFGKDIKAFHDTVKSANAAWTSADRDNEGLHRFSEVIAPVAEKSRELGRQIDKIYRLALCLIELCEKKLNARENDFWAKKEVNQSKKPLDEKRKACVEQLRQARYFYRQTRWLQERFPDAKLCDVAGLVKLVGIEEIEKNDWSLTPGRYVGVSPEEVDEEFDFEETMRAIHAEINELNAEAVELAEQIAGNFEELGI